MSRARGFTLVEVVVGLALTALVIGLLAVFSASSSRRSQRSFQTAAAAQSYLTVVGWLRRDAGRAYSTPDGALAVSGDPAGRQLAFRAAPRAATAPGAPGRLAAVSYAVDLPQQRVTRRADADEVILRPRLTELRLLAPVNRSGQLDDALLVAAEDDLTGLSAHEDAGTLGARLVLLTAIGLRGAAWRRQFPGAVLARSAYAATATASAPASGPSPAAAPAVGPGATGPETVVDLGGGDRDQGASLPASVLLDLLGGVQQAIQSAGGASPATDPALQRREVNTRMVQLRKAADDAAQLYQPGVPLQMRTPLLEYLRGLGILTPDQVTTQSTAANVEPLIQIVNDEIERLRERERALTVLEMSKSKQKTNAQGR